MSRDRTRRMRRDEYHRLVELGGFERERVELIRGLIVHMSPQGAPHAGPIEVLDEILVTALAGRARVRVQLPLPGPDDSKPEPDLAVVPIGEPHKTHPSSAHLVIEVARTSQEYDRGTKGPPHAEMGVPEFWLVDVAGRAIEVHREPTGARYARRDDPRRRDHARRVPEVAIDVARVLG